MVGVILYIVRIVLSDLESVRETVRLFRFFFVY